MGVGVDTLTVEELHLEMEAIIEAGRKEQILHANVHGLNLAYNRPWLRSMLNEAFIVFCDGAGVKIGAQFLGKHIPARITYADWIWQLAALAEEHHYSFYFLGAKPGVAQKAADNLLNRFPRLEIGGISDGYFDKTYGSRENEAIIAHINSVKPNILLIGMGMPLQERWLLDNWPRLEINVALTGGAVFDYVSGYLDRAPKQLTDNDLEWLGRLMIEPRRLWKRYLIGNPVFLYRVLRQRVAR